MMAYEIILSAPLVIPRDRARPRPRSFTIIIIIKLIEDLRDELVRWWLKSYVWEVAAIGHSLDYIVTPSPFGNLD